MKQTKNGYHSIGDLAETAETPGLGSDKCKTILKSSKQNDSKFTANNIYSRE